MSPQQLLELFFSVPQGGFGMVVLLGGAFVILPIYLKFKKPAKGILISFGGLLILIGLVGLFIPYYFVNKGLTDNAKENGIVTSTLPSTNTPTVIKTPTPTATFTLASTLTITSTPQYLPAAQAMRQYYENINSANEADLEQLFEFQENCCQDNKGNYVKFWLEN